MLQGDQQRGKVGVGCVVTILVVLVAGVVGAYLLAKLGLDVIAEEVKRDIRDHPVILEHIGNIEDMSVNLTATAAEPNEVYVFDMRGTKSEGELRAVIFTAEDGTERVREGTVRLPSGESYELIPVGRRDSPPAEAE